MHVMDYRVRRGRRAAEARHEAEELYQRPYRRYPERIEPTISLNDMTFKRTFRFDKENVVRIAHMLNLERESNRGLPLTPIQVVCIGLNHLADGHFNRISALCGNCSDHSAWVAVDRFRDAVLEHYITVVRMPTEAEKAATAQRNLLNFALPDFAYGVDGMIARYENAPRGLPDGPGLPNQQNFFTRQIF